MNLKDRINGEFILIHKLEERWLKPELIKYVRNNNIPNKSLDSKSIVSSIIPKKGEIDYLDSDLTPIELLNLIAVGSKLKTWNEL